MDQQTNKFEITSNEELNEEQVDRFLRMNPRFFVGRDRLLKQMRLPHVSGKAISLLEKQNDLLRNEVQSLEARHAMFIQNARDNDKMFNQLRSLVLDILNADNLEHLASLLETHLTQYFNVDRFKLLLSEDLLLGIEKTKLIGKLPDITNKEKVWSAIADLNESSKAMCGQFSEELVRLLFSEKNSVKSVAVASMYGEKLNGLILLGSSDSDYFKNSMDTLFLSFLSEVVIRMIKRLG